MKSNYKEATPTCRSITKRNKLKGKFKNLQIGIDAMAEIHNRTNKEVPNKSLTTRIL